MPSPASSMPGRMAVAYCGCSPTATTHHSVPAAPQMQPKATSPRWPMRSAARPEKPAEGDEPGGAEAGGGPPRERRQDGADRGRRGEAEAGREGGPAPDV